MDSLSRYVELAPVKSTEATEFAPIYLALAGRYGVPNKIRHDGGSEFCNQLITAISNLLGINVKLI